MICTNAECIQVPPIFVEETELGIHVSSRGRKHVSNWIENVSSSTKSNSWGIDTHNIFICFKRVDVSKLDLTGLVYELPKCRCIAGRTTYLPVWSLTTLVNSLQEGDCWKYALISIISTVSFLLLIGDTCGCYAMHPFHFSP